jgi:hypothetical protein
MAEGTMEIDVEADADQPMASSGRPPSSPQSVTGLPCAFGFLHDQPHGAQSRRAQRIIAARKLRVAAIGGEEELHQVVGADRGEVDDGQQVIELPQERGDLDHHAELQGLRQHMAALQEVGLLQSPRPPARGGIPPHPRSSGT